MTIKSEPLIITRTEPWKNVLAEAVRDPAELARLLALPEQWAQQAAHAARDFPLRVPRGFVARMRRGDSADPLLRQVLPLDRECDSPPGFSLDPVGDLGARKERGLLQKYHGRALLTVTGACAVHCRYCFRRHFPYAEENPTSDWGGVRHWLQGQPDVTELILSGGDPLMFDDARLVPLLDSLAGVPHLRRLRIHTRMPIVVPERITEALVSGLTSNRLQPVMIIHANHPRELDRAVVSGLQELRNAGIALFNQSVLLRGVNDDLHALVELSEALFAAGVVPYYLHLLDRVAGAAHFDVPELEAVALHEAVRRQLPGYLVPQLVREQQGEPYKTPRGRAVNVTAGERTTHMP